MESILFFVPLIIAGGDTTRNLVAGDIGASSSIRWSGRSWKRPVAATDCDRGARLRYHEPVYVFLRTADRTPNDAGCAKKGDRAAMSLPSANRDETESHPDRFDMSRTPKPDVAFAVGTHSASARTWPG